MFARHLAITPLVWSLMAPFTLLSVEAGLQVSAPDPSVPTAIESALTEHRCNAVRPPGVLDPEAYQECLSAQLLSLRADFGPALGRLSGSERRMIDSACSRIDTALRREAYAACLGEQLVALRNLRSRANPAPPAVAAVPLPSVSAPADTAPVPALPVSERSSGVWIGATLVTLLVAAGGALLARQARRASRKCRVCGTDVPDSGDLCQRCRHEAAEALRRAATERADQRRAHEEAKRRESELEEEQRRQQARQEEEARLRHLEHERQAEQARHDAELSRREEDARQQRQAGVTFQEAFDPYAVLGVARDASRDDIEAAYQVARLKYDAEHVAHLGPELQEHYKTKADAVERAYQQLTG